MTRPETMQPARAAAMAASHMVRNGVVLLPRGNDGVGIVGAFASECPYRERLMVVPAGESVQDLRARIAAAPRVVLALLAQDDASRAAIPVMLAAVSGPCWRMVESRSIVAAFDHACGGAPWDSSPASP
jgi:hypothetical protein